MRITSKNAKEVNKLQQCTIIMSITTFQQHPHSAQLVRGGTTGTD